jgi:biopolymer transport protein TolR
LETRKARRRPMAEINVVPYIDVMLVLLVIFMITAPLLNLGVEVELPKADAEPMDVQESTTSGLIDPDSLVTMVAAIVNRNPEIQVLVGGDESAGYGQVYAALVLLQKAGVTKVGLMSDPAELGYGAEATAE